MSTGGSARISSHVDGTECLFWHENMFSSVALWKRLTPASVNSWRYFGVAVVAPSLGFSGGAEGDRYHGSTCESDEIRMVTASAPSGGEGAITGRCSRGAGVAHWVHVPRQRPSNHAAAGVVHACTCKAKSSSKPMAGSVASDWPVERWR